MPIHTKRGQNWSIEAMIAITIFIAIVIVSLVTVAFLPTNNARELSEESDQVLTAVENDIGLLDDYDIDNKKLLDYEDYTAQELGEALGSAGDVCITFQTLEGNIITLPSSTKGIGLGDDLVCGN